MIQKVKEGKWKDETGNNIPLCYITAGNRYKERAAGSLLKDAKSINTKLSDFKAKIKELCDGVYRKMLEENNAKEASKGNYTWFSFDRSVKIEVTKSERIDFDDITIEACKQKLDEFLDKNLDAKQEFVKQIVTDAFSTSKGKLDSKKVMSLLKYRQQIKSALFQEALNLMEKSIRRPDSKLYFRIWDRDESGEYNLIDLNFSSIK